MENPHVSWVNQLFIWQFSGYVKWPKGKSHIIHSIPRFLKHHNNPFTERLYHIWRLPKTILLKTYVRTIRFAPPSPYGPEAGCLYRCHTALKSKAGKKFWGAIIFTQTKMEANFWPLIAKWYSMGLTVCKWISISGIWIHFKKEQTVSRSSTTFPSCLHS